MGEEVKKEVKKEVQLNLHGEKVNKWGVNVPEPEPREEWDLWKVPKGTSKISVCLAIEPEKVKTKYGDKWLLKIGVLDDGVIIEETPKDWLIGGFMLHLIKKIMLDKDSTELKVTKTGEGVDTKYEVA